MFISDCGEDYTPKELRLQLKKMGKNGDGPLGATPRFVGCRYFMLLSIPAYSFA